ncbi:HAUS augmin-like complex subunit 7 [Sphaeramia orbicularis]|uniref:HAUS augmin-like complex, subunit 7 n=1 Tax=Sphaeramia orbicularis TaxID=375764 RepID=A0A673BIF5_9TELE|nr:HAUS augmin-like complex subunit 7 [Sphaeramia orbicularis]
MAGGLKEKQLAQNVYDLLQAASCPLVEGLFLQESDSKLQLLCTPSQHRTDILAWICSSVNPNFSKEMSIRSKVPDILNKDMAALGQELMLCKADDLDLIKGEQSPLQQLQFFEQLLSLVPGCRKSPFKTDEEILLNELFAAENLPLLTQTLKPSLDPWPAHIKALHKGTKSSHQKPSSEEVDVASLLQSTQSALEQLQSECEFLTTEVQSPGVFSPSALCVAASDLQQLMATFTHVYETDLKAYCNRDPPSLSTETAVFQRVHQLLLACNTELEMFNEITEASASMTDDVSKLQMQPRYWSRGEKRTLPEQLEELTRRYRDFLSLLHS